MREQPPRRRDPPRHLALPRGLDGPYRGPDDRRVRPAPRPGHGRRARRGGGGARLGLPADRDRRPGPGGRRAAPVRRPRLHAAQPPHGETPGHPARAAAGQSRAAHDRGRVRVLAGPRERAPHPYVGRAGCPRGDRPRQGPRRPRPAAAGRARERGHALQRPGARGHRGRHPVARPGGGRGVRVRRRGRRRPARPGARPHPHAPRGTPGLGARPPRARPSRRRGQHPGRAAVRVPRLRDDEPLPGEATGLGPLV
ncbi:hypothetical protein SGPA1_20322 [Streptomyces misionensis JCM 4497]